VVLKIASRLRPDKRASCYPFAMPPDPAQIRASVRHGWLLAAQRMAGEGYGKMRGTNGDGLRIPALSSLDLTGGNAARAS